MCELVGRAPLRRWSHYTLAYANPSSVGEASEAVTLITEGNCEVWRQWQEWPGPFCSPGIAASFDVTDTFGLVRDGRLVSVAQIQAHHDEYAWEFGIDTLPEFRGRGFATTVMQSVTAYIVSRDHVPYHYSDAYNKASLRLPHKLGYDRYADILVAHPL
jgi:RimJ/RimL family protein N-acetyltransferase